MKVIIAGSRGFKDYKLLKDKCSKILCNQVDVEIVSGTANGADKLGEQFAKEMNYKLKKFPADWNNIEGKPSNQIRINSRGIKYWTLAGHHRNKQMAEYADALIAFNVNNSSGTNNMVRTATKLGLKVREIKINK